MSKESVSFVTLKVAERVESFGLVSELQKVLTTSVTAGDPTANLAEARAS